MKYRINKNSRNIKGKIDLITSKSISNRLLVIKALQNGIKINKLSESEDTKVMINAFGTDKDVIDIGHAGTAMRFLTAYFSIKPCEIILTGSDRMKNRPIKILVEALRKLGAEIDYIDKEGYPPLRIKGRELKGGKIKIDGSVSSQYITALLLISPALKEGITIELLNKISSRPYITLTIELMKYFGIEAEWEGNIIKVEPGEYLPKEITVEADWSSASYWYEMAALSEHADIFLTGLNKNSYQADSVVADMYKNFGVKTEYCENGVLISKTNTKELKKFEYNFSDCPDIVQTLAVTNVLLMNPFVISGAGSLRIKETDRIKALQNELRKLGVEIIESAEGTIEWDGKILENKNKIIEIETYIDHRMALSFAPVAMIKGGVIINDPEVVIKSYPSYWDDLRRVGFEIIEIKK